MKITESAIKKAAKSKVFAAIFGDIRQKLPKLHSYYYIKSEKGQDAGLPVSSSSPLLSKVSPICYNSGMGKRMNELKKTVFYEMLDMAGRVFIVVRYSENVTIGNRGFTHEEKQNGIILVFSRSMNFSWGDAGIASSLVFGTSPQKCFIPPEDIIAIYSPELNSQFITALQPSIEMPGKKEDAAGPEQEEPGGPNVVRVDFSRKRSPKRPERPHT
ncbi:MAG: hypothetical protein M1497_07095 [Nitrospirae bacterium]|nr:hypothetical protein [Nitrospirota bacterium]